MAENLTEVANFAAGIRDAPSFEPSSGGASRMLNYIVDADGEVLPREGYIESNAAEIHIHGDSGLDDTGGQSGPLVVIDNSHTRLFVRLPAGASWVVEQEKLFFTVPGEDTSAYWVDVSKFTVTGDDIYRWTANNNKGGDNVRPTRTHLRVKPVHGGSISATGISHPVILGLTGTPPNAQNPIEIAIHAAQNISNFKLAIKVDTQNEIDDTLELFDEDTFQVFWGVGDDNSTSSGGEGTPTVLLAGNTYVWQWAGQDGDYHSVSELAAHLASDYWAWIFGGVLGAAIDRLFIPDPPPLTTQGKGNREITQQEFERAYLELSYESGGETHKFRYYLYSHRGSAVGSQIAASLQTGLSVASSGAGNPYVAGAGAAIAAAGAAGAIISKASEGQRVKLTSLRDTPVLPAKEENGGFQVGQYVFCYTLSDEDRGIETIPSKTTEMMMFDFPSLDSSYAGRTSQRIEVRMSSSDPAKDPSWDWATHINIYAARTSNPDADNKLPQELGLEFVLIARLERSGVGNSGRTVLWTDELYYSEEGGRDDPARPLESYDNDQPLRGMENIVSYGSRIWV